MANALDCNSRGVVGLRAAEYVCGMNLHRLALFTLVAAAAHADSVQLALDLNPGARGSGPSYLVAYRGEIYFRSNSGLHNVELWRFDGSAASQVGEIHPTGSSNPTDLTVANGVLYFGANDGTGQRLWSWNGSALSKVAGAVSVQNPEAFIAFKGDLYFRGTRFSDVGTELFRWNGTALTAIDIYPGGGSGYPQHLTEFKGALYFSANGESGQGAELWRYDGTALSKAGQNIYPGNGSSPDWLTVFQGRLYFRARNATVGNELWSFDGTTSTLVADKAPGALSFDPGGMTVFKNALYFSANAQDGSGVELWKYNGTSITMVRNINPNLAANGDDWLADSSPANFTVHRNRLYFTATDGTNGYELWVYGGSGVPQMVADIAGGPSGSLASELITINNQLFLSADANAGYGQEIYRLLPTKADADADGMSDDWETDHGLNPASDDSGLDKDGDGVTNEDEFAAGTDPSSAPSTFRAELDGSARLSWPSTPGRVYTISVNDGSGWTPSQTVSAAPAPAEYTVLKVTPPVSGVRLFRVTVNAE